jgi:inner membrane protein
LVSLTSINIQTTANFVSFCAADGGWDCHQTRKEILNGFAIQCYFDLQLASFFTHALVGVTLAQPGLAEWRKDWRFWVAVVVCSILPDIDVIGFEFGVRYSDLWGHRGMTHSLLFAAVIASTMAILLKDKWGIRARFAALFFLIIVSHGLLDALTDGGLGVAFFSPFDRSRYFLPWRPIHVSPIGVGGFFSERGLRFLGSEILWVWIPSLLVILGGCGWRLRTGKADHARSESPSASG